MYDGEKRMTPKFIKIEDKIFSVSLLEKSGIHHKPNSYFISIDKRSFYFDNDYGYFRNAFECFIENLKSDELCFGSSFNCEEHVLDGKKLKNDMECRGES